MYDTVILEYEGKFGRGRTVDDIVSWVETIPPMPEVTNKALKLIDDPDSTPHEIAALLTRDPGSGVGGHAGGQFCQLGPGRSRQHHGGSRAGRRVGFVEIPAARI
jgi:hypothetical protein